MIVRKTILVLTDFSKRAERAAKLALKLAISSNSDLLLYNSVTRPEAITKPYNLENPSFREEDMEEKMRQSNLNLIQLSDQLKVSLKPEQRAKIQIDFKKGMGSITETILNLVATHDISMVVMGNRVNKELISAFFDSHVPCVVNNCECPVLLVP